MPRVEKRDFHWLVGILEGEGTFLAAAPSTPNAPVVRVAMTDHDVVERVGRLIDRAVVSFAKRAEHHRQPYATTIKGAPAAALMCAVRPWLGARRQDQIHSALIRWEPRRIRWRRIAGASRVDELPQDAAIVLSHATCDTDCELFWLAGLLEGEGSFGIARTRTGGYPVLSLKMTDEDVVRRAGHMLEARSIAREESRHPRWSAIFTAKISGAGAAEWMRRLRPAMGIRRSAAIDAALAAYHPIRLVDPPDTCVVPGCTGAHEARGLCHKHYMSWLRDMAKGRLPRVTPLR